MNATESAVVVAPALDKALLYLRVSSTQQADKDYDAEGYSLPAQRAACQHKAESLEAAVEQEFVERGESGTTANRPALQRMLTRLTQGDIRYVIVHKVDRLARNRADDVAIVMAIRQSGATLVSVSENIDETPSGLLVHGIMSSIAEFYSQNLSLEVKKGTTEKAKRGGTPFRAPIGYVNVREIIDGREIRTIAIDPDRGPLITEAFRLYATGDYSLSELGAILEARGLRGKSTRSTPGRALGTNRLAALLRNPYYIRTLRYAGKTYDGRHDALTDLPTFQAVQDVLDAQRKSGERNWRHHHYLRGSLYCADCQGRLIYTRANGNGGIYEYFVCRGRQQGTCTQPHHRALAVELAVEDHYATVQLDSERRGKIRDYVQRYVADLDARIAPERARVAETIRALDGQERKLLSAHYADQISEGLFAEEQDRLRRERAAAQKLQTELAVDHRDVLARLDVALELTDRLQAAYQLATPGTRRLFNQAIFKRIWISREAVDHAELAEPFDELITISYFREVVRNAPPRRGAHRPRGRSRTSPRNAETSAAVSSRGGSNVEAMVRAEGLEPPRLAPPAPKAGVSTNSTTPASEPPAPRRAGLYVGRAWLRALPSSSIPIARRLSRGRRRRSSSRCCSAPRCCWSS
jgi:site-specific DNA recombinase